eukprot:TRINITY_DN94352_c0_g1_i1.p1 TRINITY_DN94352_c0_g1~~TRINITY_DN94352_c0_g1_i1.p1  ORF type:complete len:245 (+),score=55.49 TRINITY_DN94352_c0_g1_i1:73-807(+)
MASLRVPLRAVARQAVSSGSLRSLSCLGRTPVFVLPSRGLQSPFTTLSSRSFSSAGAKISKVLESELKHEQDQYEQSKEIKNFLKNSDFKLVDADGDVNMTLEKTVGDKTVRIEFQLTSPFNPEGEMEGEDFENEATELSISVEDKNGAGLMFFCSTQTGEDHRYVIGNVKSYTSAEEKDSLTSYNGPEFEDLDDKLQEAFDEYLGELGMSTEICDFVDAMASDKEQREYVRWLQKVKTHMDSA